MKNKENITRENIQNLTSLWREASVYNNSFVETHLFNYSAIENMHWPNRLWLKHNLNEEILLEIKNKIFSKFPNLIIPHWQIFTNDSTQILEQNGFIKRFEQIGMSLKVNNLFTEKNDVKITLVSKKNDSILWSHLFKLSFGYEIHPSLLTNTFEKINYYIVSYNEETIGTAITHQTEQVTGIHAIGIIPEARRKGIANELMKVLINIAIRNESKYITLQASDMGKRLYLNLGFEEHFIIKNYALKQHR